MSVKQLVNRFTLDANFKSNGQAYVPENAIGVVIIPTEDGSAFVTAGFQRWTSEWPEDAKQFYLALLSGILNELMEDAEGLVNKGSQEAAMNQLKPASELSDDPVTSSYKNDSEFGSPTITQTGPIEDLKVLGNA